MLSSSHSRFWPDAGEAIRTSLKSCAGLALEAGSTGVNWAELARRIADIDVALDRAGILPGDTLAVPGRNDIDCAIAVLALIATGRGAAIINPFLPGAAMIAASRATKPAAILLPEGDPALHAAEPNDPVLVLTKAGGVIRHFAGVPHHTALENRRALCIGTSGTTGDPKLIGISAATLSRAMVEIAQLNKGFGDRRLDNGSWPALLQYSPLVHVGGALTLIRAAVQGRAVVMLDKFDPTIWADIVHAHRPFTTGLPPTMMRMVLDAEIEPERLRSLISIWSGTAPARESDWDAFSERFGLPILGNYGATEFCGAIAAWSLDDHRNYFPERRKAVGRLDKNIARARIRSADGRIVGDPSEVGTLEVKVHRVSDEWLPTSDLASLDGEGFLTLHGRLDDAIIRGGFKLMPEKIAAILMKHPAVREAVVIGLADERLGHVPVAVVETLPGAAISESDLRAFVRDRMPAYFVPVAVRALDALPRTSSLKVDRRAIRSLFPA